MTYLYDDKKNISWYFAIFDEYPRIKYLEEIIQLSYLP